MLGQIKMDEKSSEITAILQLLETLGIKRTTVTIDAMDCLVDITEKILKREAHYL